MRSLLLAAVVGGLAVSGAVGRNVINEHGPYTEGVHFTIDRVGEDDVGVLIRKDSVWSMLWKFEAYDSATGAPGYIDYIRIEPWDDVGYIRLRIVGAPGHPYGAQDVKKIDLLTHADNTTEVFSIYISGDLGATAAIEAHKIGSIYAGGNLLHSISAEDDITGTITINGNLFGGIYGDSLATVTVNGAGPHTGNIFRRHASTQTDNITISSSYGGDISIGTDLAAGGDITIGTYLSGSLDIGGDCSGTIGIGGNASGSIDVYDECSGDIAIGGDLSGTLDIGTYSSHHLSGSISVGGQCAGDIDVAGDLNGPLTVAAERLPLVISIAQELAAAYADTPRGEFWAAVVAELEG